MIIGLENKMENMKIDIVNTVTKQLDSLKFQQKLMKEQESQDHITKKCPSIPRLKAVFIGG